MKRILFIPLMFLVLFVYAQNEKDLARVNKMQGVEVYFMSEPLRKYEVVVDASTGIKMTSVATGGLVNESVADKAAQFVKRALKESDGKIDAVVYGGGKKVVGVKFTDESDPKKDGLARVNKVDGIPVFLFADPLKEYSVVDKAGGGFKVKSAMTGGIVNNSIEEDIKSFVNKLSKDGAEAVIYTSGKSAIGIKFK